MAAMEMDVEAPPQKSIEESVQGMYQSMINVQESSLLMMLCLTSALEMFAGIGVCDSVNNCSGLLGWAVSVGAISLALSLPMLYLLYSKHDLYGKVAPYATGFLFIWWVLGAGITTFAGPFFQVGNGYIGAWGAFLSSFLLAHSRIAGASWQQLSGTFKNLTSKMGKRPNQYDNTHTSPEFPPPPPAGQQAQDATHAPMYPPVGGAVPPYFPEDNSHGKPQPEASSAPPTGY